MCIRDSNLDSGSIDHVMHKDVARHCGIRETEYSRKGAYYEGANGSRILNRGERDIRSVTDDYKGVNMTFQVADVKDRCVLGSVKKICEAGNKVTFDDKGGVIINNKTQVETPFKLNEKGAYMLRLWVKKNDVDQGFQRQA